MTTKNTKRILSYFLAFAVLMSACFLNSVFSFTTKAERTVSSEFNEEFSGNSEYTNVIDDQTLPDGWSLSLTSGTVSYSDEAMVIPSCSWGTNNIITPISLDFLDDNGVVNGTAEFDFSADISLLNTVTSTSYYFGMFFNYGGKSVKNLIYPYASTVSMAENSFSFDNSLSVGQVYNLKLTYQEGIIKYYIDDTCISSIPWQGVFNGSFGFTTYGTKISVDNVDITIYEDDAPLTDYSVSSYQLNTGIKNPPTVVYNAISDEIDSVISAEKRPSVIEVSLDSNLYVYDTNGNKISESLADWLQNVYTTMIPMFRVEDDETATALCDFALKNQLLDALVTSKNVQILKTVVTTATALHGIYDASNIDIDWQSADIWENVVKPTINAMANTVILPSEALDAETVRYIQKYSISVWASVSAENTYTDLYSLVTYGVNGIVSTNYTDSIEVIESFTEETIMQSPIIYGHRGGISGAPECSLHTAMLAFDAGADGVEIDVLSSSDGKVIVSHDQTTNRLFTEDLNIRSSTWDELSQLTYRSPTEIATRINCLDDYFDAFVDGGYFAKRDFIIVVELKFDSEKLRNAIVELVEKYQDYDIERHIIFRQTGTNSGLIDLRKQLPNVNVDVAYLSTHFASQAEMYSMSQYSKAVVVPYLADVSAEDVTIYQTRGTMLNLWGIYSSGNQTTSDSYGVISVTTDIVASSSEYVVEIPVNDIYLASTDNTVSFDIDVLHQDGSVSASNDFEISVLSGDLTFTKNDDGSFGITENSGSATVSVNIDKTYGNCYPKYSKAFTINYNTEKSEEAISMIERISNAGILDYQDILADYEKLSDYDKICVGSEIYDLVDNYSPSIIGSSICTNNEDMFGELSFNVSNPAAFGNYTDQNIYVSEIGVMIVPYQLLGSQEFVLGNENISDSYLLANKVLSDDDVISEYVNYNPILRNSSKYTFVKFAVRAYVTYTDGTNEVTYYSSNSDAANEITDGIMVCSRNRNVRLAAQDYLNKGFVNSKITTATNLRNSWSFDTVWQYLCDVYEQINNTIVPAE